MTKVYLIRHGETEWNKIGRFQGQSDVPLSELGVLQAETMARNSVFENIDRIYASDLSRAVGTAKPLAEKFNLDIETHKEFREIHFGEWEGQYFEHILKTYPEEMNKFYTEPETIAIPGSETFIDFEKRATDKLNEVVELNKGKTIAIVTHGATIRVILASMLSMPLNAIWRIAQFNTAVNMIRYERGGFPVLERLNDITHLNNIEVLSF